MASTGVQQYGYGYGYSNDLKQQYSVTTQIQSYGYSDQKLSKDTSQPPPYQASPSQPHRYGYAYYDEGFGKDDPQDIFLYTTPLQMHAKLLGITRPHDVFSHWAVCVNGMCYELTSHPINEEKIKKTKKGKRSFQIQCLKEQAWVQHKLDEGRQCKKTTKPAGRTCKPLTHDTIKRICEL